LATLFERWPRRARPREAIRRQLYQWKGMIQESRVCVLLRLGDSIVYRMSRAIDQWSRRIHAEVEEDSSSSRHLLICRSDASKRAKNEGKDVKGPSCPCSPITCWPIGLYIIIYFYRYKQATIRRHRCFVWPHHVCVRAYDQGQSPHRLGKSPALDRSARTH
jgi:hypothetical protein